MEVKKKKINNYTDISNEFKIHIILYNIQLIIK